MNVRERERERDKLNLNRLKQEKNAEKNTHLSKICLISLIIELNFEIKL